MYLLFINEFIIYFTKMWMCVYLCACISCACVCVIERESESDAIHFVYIHDYSFSMTAKGERKKFFFRKKYNTWRKIFFLMYKKLYLQYSQTWVNNHLRIMTTCLERPLFWGLDFNFHYKKLPLNNNHQSTTATNFGSRGWSLYTGLTVINNLI